MTLGDRIKEIRNSVPQRDFAAKFGATPNTLRRYETNANPPGADFISAICTAHKINPSWLLFGTLPKYEADKTCNREDGDSFYFIPMVETKLSAGGGAFVESEDVKGYYAFRKDWIHRVASGSKDLFLMRVIGDSMAPTIQARDTVMIDTNRKDLKEGEIYAIRFDHTVMIKRLAFRPEGRVLIMSDNRKEFEAYEVEAKNLHIIGQIIFFSRVLISE